MQDFDFVKPGDVFDSRYEVIAALGQGATGIVVKVKDLQTADIRALKILFPHLVRNESTIERFRNEVRILRRISHPNVLRVYNFHTSDTGYHYISMEYFKGDSLRAHLESEGRYSEDDVVPILISIARGMSAAHAEGVVHRDLKPDNILISDELEVKIVDFGLAKALDENSELTATGVGVGTPYYMSPEQLLGEEATEASDVYSYGIVGFHLLVGEPPYTGDSLVDLARKHMESSFPYARLQEVGCSPWLANLLGRCVEKKTSRRCDSFDYVCSLLELKSSIVSRAQLSIVDNIVVIQDSYRHLFRGFLRPRSLPYVFYLFALIWLLQCLFFVGHFNLWATEKVFSLEKRLELQIPLTRLLFIRRERSVEQLNQCIRSGALNCASMLARTVDSVNVADKNGDYPILMAARYGTRDTLIKLLHLGADPNIIDAKTGESALFAAVRGGAFMMVRDLNRAGANISQLDYSGRSVFTVLFEDFKDFRVSGFYYPDVSSRKEGGTEEKKHESVLYYVFKELLRFPGASAVADRKGRLAEDFLRELELGQSGESEISELESLLGQTLARPLPFH